MIVIVGGTGSVGKTQFSNRLLHVLGIPYISVDHIMMGFYRSNSDCGFTPMSKMEIIAERLWPFICEVIKTNIENEHNIIIEGAQLLPRYIQSFSKEYRDKIIPVYICFSQDYIKTKYSDIISYRGIIEKRTDIDNQDQMIQDCKELIEECKRFNVKHFAIEDDYTISITKVEKYITDQYIENCNGFSKDECNE